MTRTQQYPPTRNVVWLAAALLLAGVVAGCAAEAKVLDPHQIEQQYGVSGAYTGTIATPNGSMQGTIIPITLADGRSAQLVIPQRQASDVRSVYLVDNDGLHPVQRKENASGRRSSARRPSCSGGLSRNTRTHAGGRKKR